VAEALSQKEIDALISALSTGEVEVGEAGGVLKTPQRQIRVYDFHRPDKFSKDQVRSLEMIHDNFARLLTTAFSANFRTMVQVSMNSVYQLPFGEFIQSADNPTVLAIVNPNPLPGKIVMELHPSIAFPMIDRMLGGPGDGHGKNRALTEIERVVIRRVFTAMMDSFVEAWRDVIKLEPEVEGIETNPLFTQILPPGEMVAAVTLPIRMGDYEGILNLFLPHIVMEPILPRLSTHQWFSTVRRFSRQESRDRLTKRLMDVPLTVSAVLGEVELTLGELVNLQKGDVLLLTETGELKVTLLIEGRPKFRAKPGRRGKHAACRIEEHLDGGENDEL